MPRKKKRTYGDGSVFFDKANNRWVGKFRAGSTKDGKPRYAKVYAESRDDAQRLMDDAIRESTKMQPENVGSITVTEFLTTWLQTVEKAHLAPKSYDRKEQSIRLEVIPHIGSIAVGELTSDDVQRMITKLKDAGKSLSTIKKAREAVSAAYRWGMQCKPPKVSSNPALGVQMPTKKTLPPKKIECFSLDEARALCKAAYAVWGNGKRVYRLGGAVELLINSGLRLAEIVALRWTHVDLDKKFLTVSESTVHVRDYSEDATTRYKYVEQDSTKTASGTRVIPLNGAAIHALQDLQRVTGSSPYVLATEDGTPVRERALDRMLEAVGKRAGLPDERLVSAHKLRHTFASLFLYGGGKGHRGDVKILSELLGHADVATTYNIYTHVLRAIKAEDLEQMPAVTGEETKPGPRVTTHPSVPVFGSLAEAQSELEQVFPDTNT